LGEILTKTQTEIRAILREAQGSRAGAAGKIRLVDQG
jgi:hypothetical protein